MAAQKNSKRNEMTTILATLENRLTQLFGARYQEVIRINQIRKAIEAGQEFKFDSSPAAARQMEAIISQLAMQASSLIKQGDKEAWEAGDKNASRTLAATFGKTTDGQKTLDALTERGKEDMRARGATAEQHYRNREESVAFSTGVWKEQAQKDLELIIQNGIKQGKSAEQISRDIRPFLNNPNAYYRRVRNKETGELELSEAAKKYHPGAGVYRSAFKNALRLARTEVNIAYATAQWETFQSNPLVTGIRISLSNNHTTLNRQGKRVPLHDMCDELQGDYPKTFRWTPWHPQCRCTMTPITISDDDFKKRMSALFAGTLDDWKPQDTVTKMPETFTGWMDRNKERLAKGKSIPAFVKDNYLNGNPLAKLNPAITNLEDEVRKQALPATKQELTKEQKEMQQIIDNRRKWSRVLEIQPADFAPLEEMMRLGDREHFDIALDRLDDKMMKRMQEWSNAQNQLYHDIEDIKKLKPTIQLMAGLTPDEMRYFQNCDFSRTLGEKYDAILKQYEVREKSPYTYTQAKQALEKAQKELQKERAELFTMQGKRKRLQEFYERHKGDEYSPNMPEELRDGGAYGGKIKWSREFFDKLDPEKPVPLRLKDTGSDTYYKPSSRYVQVCKGRGNASPFEKVTVIYHEYGHAIDFTPLRHSGRIGTTPEFTAMYEAQKKRYLANETRIVTWRSREFVRNQDGSIATDENGKLKMQSVYNREEQTKKRLYFIERRLTELANRLKSFSPETLAKYGVNKADIVEAQCSAADMIMSLHKDYGTGHTKAYMSSLENRTTEYLAHAFEAAYKGNPLLKKVMPELYQEIIAFVRGLPNYWDI